MLLRDTIVHAFVGTWYASVPAVSELWCFRQEPGELPEGGAEPLCVLQHDHGGAADGVVLNKLNQRLGDVSWSGTGPKKQVRRQESETRVSDAWV